MEKETTENKETVDNATDITTLLTILSENCTMPENILKFDFSFGYNCRKFFNLINPDPNNLIFTSGNLINIFNIETKQLSFIRTTLGGSIGSIKLNPNPEFPYLTIAENSYKDRKPLIIIYEWPTFDTIRVLEGGALKYYNDIDYSFDGILLASQSGQPDCMITIWKWEENMILLRTKSYINDVYRIKFSNYNLGQLTTCGNGNIRFWQIEQTFTGIKINGNNGRYDKTKFIDIVDILSMFDGKILSGCNWGNILLWENNSIKLEICCNKQKSCHKLPILQLIYNNKNNELITISMDGHIKFWWYRTIEQTILTDKKQFIGIEPNYDFSIPNAMFMCITKRYFDNDDDTTYFAQDGNGGIWLLDLNKDLTMQTIPQQLYKCHGGRIMDIVSCPWGPYLISLGEDGQLILYQYIEKLIIFHHKFPSNGSCLIWFNSKLSSTGDELILGFEDGALRICIITILPNYKEIELRLVQIIKPHSKTITKLTINKDDTLLISASADSTIFIFQIKYENYPMLIPIGFVTLPNPATCLMWHYLNIHTIIIGSLCGEIIEIEITKDVINNKFDNRVSYQLNDLKQQISKFISCKSQIRRNEKILELRENKIKELKKHNRYLDDDTEICINEDDLEPIHIPEIPNRILWMQMIDNNRILLSMGGYDAGYLYEYNIDEITPKPTRYLAIPGGEDDEIYTFVYNYNKKCLIFAMQNGEIRINKLVNQNLNDLSDYCQLSLHNNINNYIPKICYSYNEHYIFTCDYDGNLFSLKFNPDNDLDYIPAKFIKKIQSRKFYPEALEDQSFLNKLTIEQECLKNQQDYNNRLINNKKKQLHKKLDVLTQRYLNLKERNLKLIKSQQIRQINEFDIDERINYYIDKKFETELELIHDRLAYDLEKSQIRARKLQDYLIYSSDLYPICIKAFNQNRYVQCLPIRKLSYQHYGYLYEIQWKISADEYKSIGQIEETDSPPQTSSESSSNLNEEDSIEDFLSDLSPSTIESCLGDQFNRALNKYRCRRKKWQQRQNHWNNYLMKKPTEDINSNENTAILEAAKQTIGYFKLKSSNDCKISLKQCETAFKKYKQLLLANEKLYELRHDFNLKVYKLREIKTNLYRELDELTIKLGEIQQELDKKDRIKIPIIEKSKNYEYPERNFENNIINLNVHEEDEEIIETPIKILQLPNFDNYEKQILGNFKNENINKSDCRDILDLDFDKLLQLSSNKRLYTNWEVEIYEKRYQRKLIEQQQIIEKINKKINNFNKQLIELNDESSIVEINSNFLNHFIYILNQELIILKDYGELEDNSRNILNESNKELHEMKNAINNSEVNIKKHEQDIEQLMEKDKRLEEEFQEAVQESNQCSLFFRKVFAKKLETTADDGQRKIDKDLDVCPKRCDTDIFNSTINLRSQRYEIKREIEAKTTIINILKEDIENCNEKINSLDITVKKAQNELETYQMEKQEKLNEIRTIIVLSLDQIQNLDENEQTSNIMESLVFSKQELTRLYRRVDELVYETDCLKKEHLPKIHHLSRISTDMKFMENRLQQLKYEMAESIKKQFGSNIDVEKIEKNLLKKNFEKDILTELEEIVLKKYIHDLRLSETDLKKIYANELNFWKGNVERTQNGLKTILKENTQRQELLKMLLKEKFELRNFIEIQNDKQKFLINIENNIDNNRKEIEKFEKIIEKQNDEIVQLKNEIKRLKTKGLLPPKIIEKKPIIKTEMLEELNLYEESIGEEEFQEEGDFSYYRTLHLPETSESVVRNLLEEMWENLNIQLTQKSQENFIKTIMSNIFDRFNISQVVNDLINNLPIKIPDEKVPILEITAEKLLTISDTELNEDLEKYCAEILQDLLNGISALDEPVDIVSTFINELISQLPIDFIKKQTSMEMIIERFIELSLNNKLDEMELENKIENELGREIIKEILDNVYKEINI